MADYAEVAELRARIEKFQPEHDFVLQPLITAASAQIDGYCNRPDGFIADTVATTRLYPGSGAFTIAIDEAVEITTVAVKDAATETTYTAWAANDWIPFSGEPEAPNFNRLPYTGLMVSGVGERQPFTSGKFSSTRGFRPDILRTRNLPTVQVTAKWGYAVTVPPQIREATIIMAARWYKRGQSAWSDTMGNTDLGILMYRKPVDPDVLNILENGRFMRLAL